MMVTENYLKYKNRRTRRYDYSTISQGGHVVGQLALTVSLRYGSEPTNLIVKIEAAITTSYEWYS